MLTDSTDTLDNWAGTCTPEDSVGNDVVVHFRAGQTGFWRFSTAGTEHDTLIYALADCNDGFSEIKCNDDAGGGKQSSLLLEMEAGEEVFIVVDSVNVRESRPFTLTAEQIEAAAATVDEIDAFFNSTIGTTGVRLSGTNPDSPVVGFQLQVYGTNGQALLREPFAARFDEVEILRITQEAGTFEVEGSFYLGDGAPAVGAVELALVDENDLVSEKAKADTREPDLLDRGTACDPNQALNRCGADDACAIRAPSTEYTCVVATRPTLATATAYVNLEAGVWGVVVEGNDPEADVLYARVLPKRASGTSLAVGQSGRTVVPFHQLGHDAEGNFRGVVSLPARFDGPCLVPAQQAYTDCRNQGGSEQACNDSAVAQLLACYDTTLGLIARVDVEVLDATGRLSTISAVEITPSPAVEEGGVCDPFGAIGQCPEGLICWSEEAISPETCHTDGPACPDDFGTIDLMAHESGTRWVYEGNSAESATRTGGSCGGGGPADVFSFTAPVEGTYQINTSALGSGVDTVLYVRNFCQLSAYEVACNDDTALSDTASRVSVPLAAGESIYIFVDSFEGNAPGAYTLTVTRP